MSSEAVPQEDTGRLALLNASRLLDGPPNPACEALVRLLARNTRSDAASLTLGDTHRLVSIAHTGPWPKQQTRQGSLCDQVLVSGRAVKLDEVANPEAWPGPHPIAYMGHPLHVEGQVLGVLCAVRHDASPWSDADQATLQDIACAAQTLLAAQVQAQRSQLMEDRVRMASLAGSDWLWETDAEGRLQWVSAGLTQHLGIDPASEKGIRGIDLYRPRNDDTRASWDRFMAARARHEPFTDAIAERDTPRGTITVSISGRPIFGQHGEFAGYRGASRIITRQLRIEQEARRADQWLREAFDAFPLTVMISAPDGKMLLANRLWWGQLGRDHEGSNLSWPALLRELVYAGVYPDAVGREEAFIDWRLNLHREDTPQEIRFRDRWLFIRDHQLPDGCIVHFTLDVTASKQDAAKLAAHQRALADTQARLGAVLKALPDLWFVLDAQGHHVAGHEHHPMLLQPLESLHGRKLGANLPPAAAQAQQEALSRLQATGRPQRLEYNLTTADGVSRHFEARLTLMPEDHTLFITRDITERQLAAEKLRVSEELYRSVAATISDGLMIVELSGRVVALNAAACRILHVEHGATSPQVMLAELGVTWLADDLVHPLPPAQWPLNATLQHGERVVDRVHPLRCPNGDIVWVQVSSHLLRVSPEAAPFAAMATLRDITRERQAQQDLQSSEERWKFALEGAGDGVWDWDIQHKQVYFSPRWKKQLGYQDEEVPNSQDAFLALIHPDDQPLVEQEFARLRVMPHATHQLEFRMRHRDGHYLTILSRGRVVNCDPDGRPLRMVGTQSDITRLKQAERALIEVETAEAASAAKTEFLSRMSHEVRTPLNAIIGFAQLLELQLVQDESEGVLAKGAAQVDQRYVHQILHAGRHLMGLVNDVLDLQKVEAGVLNFRPERVRLHDEIGHCIEMLQPLAERGHIQLHDRTTEDVELVVDRQRLRQVVMNLASNAIKYNQTGGSVTMSARVEPDEQIELRIEDTGVGMSARELGRLFQPFERLGRETSAAEGTGLGLIITRSLVEAMGGHMDLRSEPGVGTRVSVWLPLRPTDALELDAGAQREACLHRDQADSAANMRDCEIQDEPPVELTDAAASTPHPLRVLYVEDNRINAMLFEEALRPYEQIELDIAEDGQMALAMVRECLPDVLVLDAHLPGMSGFEVLAALRQVPGLAQTPAYMCSADAMPDDIARAQAAGFSGYWTKPIDILAVTSELNRLAAQPRQQVSHEQ